MTKAKDGPGVDLNAERRELPEGDEGEGQEHPARGADYTEGDDDKGPAEAELRTVAQAGSGLEQAESHLAQFDEGVTLLWDVTGPKKSRIDRLAAFLVTFPGNPPSVIMCQVMKSGAFGFYVPAVIAAQPPPKED